MDEREEEDAEVEVAFLGAVGVQGRAEEQRGDDQRVEQHLKRQYKDVTSRQATEQNTEGASGTSVVSIDVVFV